MGNVNRFANKVSQDARCYSTVIGSVVLGAIVVFLCGCGEDRPESDATVVPAVEPFQLGEISRMHRTPGFLFAGQPSPADFQKLKEFGVKTVVNLSVNFAIAAIVDMNSP